MIRFWLVLVVIAIFYTLWRRLSARARRAAIHAGRPEQTLLLRLRLPQGQAGGEASAIIALEEAIEAALRRDSSGELDGHELRDGVWTLYLYGPDAKRIFESIEAVLRAVPLEPGSHAIARHGARGAREVRIPLS
jgi:hypothetical protein